MKSFKCFIENCPNDPEHICKCTPSHTVFCSSHARNHMTKKSENPHEWIDLYFEPNPESRLLVIEKVNEIKKDIRLCLDKLVLQYRELLATIESSLSIGLEKYYKLDAECNDIILFVSQERILNMPTENKIEEPLKLDSEECKKIIGHWGRIELEAEIDEIKRYIEKTYENIEVNPFQVANKSTIDSKEIHFITNNYSELNTLNLSLMRISKTKIEIPEQKKAQAGYYKFDGTKLSNVLIPNQLSVFFNGACCQDNRLKKPGRSYTGLEPWTFIVNQDKTVKFLQSGTQSTKPSLTFYKDHIYALGGTQNSVSEKYDFKKNIWENLVSLPQGCFCCSHSALFEDKILITALCLNELISYGIKENSYSKIQNLYLSQSLNKSILSYDRRAYILEFGGNIYQSALGDISKWESIGNSQLSNSMVQSYSVAFNGNIYFIIANNQLVEFNLKTKITRRENFAWER